MAPKKSLKKSKNTRNGRASTKLDKLLGLCSKLTEELQSIRKQNKTQRRQIHCAEDTLAEICTFLMNKPVVSSDDNFRDSSCCRSSHDEAESSGKRRLRLSFACELPSELFTANTIYAVGDGTDKNVVVRVELLDENNNVVNEGPLSSPKIEVFLARGNIKPEDWTEEEGLEKSRVCPREEKGSLLVGSCVRTMENGACCFNDLKIVDNSSWVPSKMLRLVAKVAGGVELEIRPAVSGPFRVKDQRGKQYEKHSVPSSDDDVWRLKMIRRNGLYHKKLEEQGITTVKDFLQRYYKDESSLRKILGAKDGVWATIVQHAKDCPDSEQIQYASEDQNNPRPQDRAVEEDHSMLALMNHADLPSDRLMEMWQNLLSEVPPYAEDFSSVASGSGL